MIGPMNMKMACVVFLSGVLASSVMAGTGMGGSPAKRGVKTQPQAVAGDAVVQHAPCEARIAELEKLLADRERELAELRLEIATLREENGQLRGELNTRESRIQELQGEADALRGAPPVVAVPPPPRPVPVPPPAPDLPPPPPGAPLQERRWWLWVLLAVVALVGYLLGRSGRKDAPFPKK